MGSSNTKEEVIIAQSASGNINFHYTTSLITIGIVLLVIIAVYYLNKFINKKITKLIQKTPSANTICTHV